jgi:hypothetical protein
MIKLMKKVNLFFVVKVLADYIVNDEEDLRC